MSAMKMLKKYCIISFVLMVCTYSFLNTLAYLRGRPFFVLEAFLLLSNMELSLLTRVNCGSHRITA